MNLWQPKIAPGDMTQPDPGPAGVRNVPFYFRNGTVGGVNGIYLYGGPVYVHTTTSDLHAVHTDVPIYTFDVSAVDLYDNDSNIVPYDLEPVFLEYSGTSGDETQIFLRVTREADQTPTTPTVSSPVPELLEVAVVIAEEFDFSTTLVGIPSGDEITYVLMGQLRPESPRMLGHVFIEFERSKITGSGTITVYGSTI